MLMEHYLFDFFKLILWEKRHIFAFTLNYKNVKCKKITENGKNFQKSIAKNQR